jgi:hypothetical protein
MDAGTSGINRLASIKTKYYKEDCKSDKRSPLLSKVTLVKYGWEES